MYYYHQKEKRCFKKQHPVGTLNAITARLLQTMVKSMSVPNFRSIPQNLSVGTK